VNLRGASAPRFFSFERHRSHDFFYNALKPEPLFLVFGMPHQRSGCPSGARRGRGAGGVRRLLVPILLNGEFGYENYLRFCSPFAIEVTRSQDTCPPHRDQSQWLTDSGVQTFRRARPDHLKPASRPPAC
jgi:hypothetical protein